MHLVNLVPRFLSLLLSKNVPQHIFITQTFAQTFAQLSSD